MRLGAALLLALCVGCGARTGSAVEPAEPAPEVAEDVSTAVRGAVEQYRQAYEVLSMEALAPLYAHELDVSLVEQGVRHRGWSEVESMLRERISGARSARLAVRDLEVAALGEDGAMATASVERTFGDGTTSVTERGTLTLVFRRGEGDAWRIVAEHFSYPVGGSP